MTLRAAIMQKVRLGVREKSGKSPGEPDAPGRQVSQGIAGGDFPKTRGNPRRNPVGNRQSPASGRIPMSASARGIPAPPQCPRCMAKAPV
jgi:hypothetical protein